MLKYIKDHWKKIIYFSTVSDDQTKTSVYSNFRFLLKQQKYSHTSSVLVLNKKYPSYYTDRDNEI